MHVFEVFGLFHLIAQKCMHRTKPMTSMTSQYYKRHRLLASSQLAHRSGKRLELLETAFVDVLNLL